MCMFVLFQAKKDEGGKDKASIEDSAFEALEKDFQDVGCLSVKNIWCSECHEPCKMGAQIQSPTHSFG